MSDPTRINFSALPKKQREALGYIALGAEGGFHPATIKALEKRGLIEHRDVRAAGERLPFYDRIYFVPLPIHMQWCAWCSEQQATEDDEGLPTRAAPRKH